jgi:DNA-directed RNA polymerase subunit RPC12/RpoP
MRNFFNNIRNKLANFMVGRYGVDELNQALGIGFLIFWILSLFTGKRWLYYIALVLFAIEVFRMLSKNYAARSKERLAYLKIVDKIKGVPNKVKQRWSQRKTHKFYRCKQCHVTIRVPKGLGKVEITCPKCGYKFIKKT